MKIVVALALLVGLLHDLPAEACAPAPPPGARVAMAEEEAAIIWDPATKTEHFIRRVNFSSTARSFGFLVPTPTTPQLAEERDQFSALAGLAAPKVVYQSEGYDVGLGCAVCGVMRMGTKGGVDAAPVQIIQSAHVAGFDATTLAAETPEALSAWLAEHGFARTPQLDAWVARYVADKWQITAFTVTSDQAAGAAAYDVGTKVVRMSFHTERPFFPYREPEPVAITTVPAVTPIARSLRVFFLSTARYEATKGTAPWDATLNFAGRWNPEGLWSVAASATWASVFIDDSNPRRGTDEVYFAPSANQMAHQATQIVKVPREMRIPIDLLIVVALIAYLAVRVYRRLTRRAR